MFYLAIILGLGVDLYSTSLLKKVNKKFRFAADNLRRVAAWRGRR
jgi:hypothetical protein